MYSEFTSWKAKKFGNRSCAYSMKVHVILHKASLTWYVSLSSQNNELTSEIDFFAWMKSWSNFIWVSKVTPDFFLWCWNCILCSDCLGKKNSRCGQGFKQHQKEGFLCSLGEYQPFVQMKTEAVKSALLVRNVLNAILYHICTTTIHFSEPERTQHPG